MWVTALNIVTLAAMLAALNYVAVTTRKLDATLGSLLREGSEGRRVIESKLQRVRQSLAEMKQD